MPKTRKTVENISTVSSFKTFLDSMKMRCELPECWRACCCLPLRRGILLFAYLNVVYCILELFSILAFSDMSTMYHGVALYYVNDGIAIALYCVEFFFHIILIIGAHMKSEKTLRVFYYYGVSSTFGTFLVFVVTTREIEINFSDFMIEGSFFFCGLVLQVYLLLLVRSEQIKLKAKSLLFVNPTAEQQMNISTLPTSRGIWICDTTDTQTGLASAE